MRNADQQYEAFMNRRHSIDDVSLVDNKTMSLDNMLKITVSAAFREQDADAKVYGGDGATHKNHLKGQLKHLDKRLQPFLHEDITSNLLKSIHEMEAPNGARVSSACLQDRIVGILFFSESRRSHAFMLKLEEFAKKYHPHFAVVCISLCSRECVDISHRHGFFHVTHSKGAFWVQRDCGLMVRPFLPPPKLVVVNGNNGNEITRSGLTAVLCHPDTCFSEWRAGREGFDFRDYPRTWIIN